MTTAIVHARVSSVKQAEKQIPIDSQLERGRQLAEKLGAKVLREFVDRGISGRTSARPEFQAAIEYCELMNVTYFIVWDTARFARNRIDAALLKQRLRRSGTKVVYVAQDIDPTTDDGWLLEGLYELFDEQRSRSIGKDTKRSMMKNARDGFFNGGRVPFGYQVVEAGKRRRLEVLEHEASIVRQIFSDYVGGAGLKVITLSLNRAGLANRGRAWSKNTVNYLLQNWVYAGYLTFNRVGADGEERPEADWIRTRSHPAIVEEDVFLRVQELLERRAPARSGGSNRSGYAFTGLMRCGVCGRGMFIETATGRKATYAYYNCSGALRGGTCPSRRIPAPMIESQLLHFLVERLINRQAIEDVALQIQQLKGEWVKERAARREVLVAEMRDVERRRSNLFELLELHGKGAPNLGDLTGRLQELNARIRAIEGELTALEAAQPPAATPAPAELELVEAFMRETITKCENPKKVRTFLGSFIEKIEITGQHAVVHYNPAKLVDVRPLQLVHSDRKWLPDWGNLRTAILSMPLPERYRRAA